MWFLSQSPLWKYRDGLEYCNANAYFESIEHIETENVAFIMIILILNINYIDSCEFFYRHFFTLILNNDSDVLNLQAYLKNCIKIKAFL